MDNGHITYTQDSSSRESFDEGAWSHPAKTAATKLMASMQNNTVDALRPYVPQIVPIVVFLALVPLVFLVSGLAGYLVWKNIAVSWNAPLYLQFGDGRAPHAEVVLPKLSIHQAYDFSIRMTVPAVESNLALGNFMTTLSLTTASNQTLVSESRPAIAFAPESSILYFWRSKRTTINLHVPMVANYAPGISTVIANVEIGRQDNWKSLGNGEGRELSVLNASIEGTIIHSGLRGLVTRYPFAFSVISAGAFGIILSSILGFCIVLPAIRDLSLPEEPRTSPTPPERRDEPKEEEDEEEARRAFKRPRVSGRRRGAGRTFLDSRIGSSVFTSSRSKSTSLRKRIKIPDEFRSDHDEENSQD